MSDLTPSRREFAAGGLAATLAASAGCLAGLGDGDEAAAKELRLRLDREGDTLRDRFVVDLTETRPDWDEEAFAAARAGESYTTQYRKPFYSTPEDPEYARHESTYYRLGSVVVDEVETTHPILRLFEADGDSGDVVAHESLPEPDQRAVFAAYAAARARGSEGGVPWGLVQRGGYVYRDEAAVEDSRLLAEDGPSRVTYRDTTYRVEVTTETFHEPVYRATADRVADSPERMEAILRAQFVTARIGRDDLSRDARDAVREAENSGYAETHPFSEAYRSVLLALHERAYLDGDVQKDALADSNGREMVRYDGTYFEYHLRFVEA